MAGRSALDVAKYIITKCSKDFHMISNLQLQKILYYIQVEFYKEFDQPCFDDEFQAWLFGPVVPSVYSEYCGAGSSDIFLIYDFKNQIFDAEEKTLVDHVVEQKRTLNPWKMVEDTHAPGKAWAKIYQNGSGNKNIMPKELIKQYG